MSNDDYDSPADIQADICEATHNDYDPDCPHCEYRRTLVHCSDCGADFEDGKWWNVRRTPGTPITGPNGCGHETLMDDWGHELTCDTNIKVGETMDGRAITQPCGDPIEHAGNTACDHHQRWIDAEEAARVYQRLVAAR